jgi:UDPglucose 6-dehydrogenase
MKIGVIGGGTVGRATARCYLEFADEVRVYDTNPLRSTHGVQETTECDIVFLCLPEDRLDNYFDSISPGEEKPQAFVIKSTVPVGTCRRLGHDFKLTNLLHCPEFLTARCSEVDAKVPSQLVIGTGRRSRPGLDRLQELYERRFPGVNILEMSWEESELLKLALNSFFAVKVAFFNEIEEYCRRTNLSYDLIRRGVLGDGRVTAHHTLVPGPDGRKGFGGACLPKDLRHLIRCLQRANLPAPVCSAAYARNEECDRLRDST